MNGLTREWLRQILREELEDGIMEFEFSKSKYPKGVKIQKVEYNVDYGAVGLCIDADTKRLFLADVEDFRVSEIQRLPSEIRADGLGCDMLYDWKYDTFFVYVCRSHGENYLYRLSSDLTKVLAKTETNIGGGDRGALAIADGKEDKYRLFYLTDDETELSGAIPEDTSLMPSLASTGLPLRAEGKKYGTYNGEAGKTYAHDGTLPLARWGDELVGFITLHSGITELHASALAFYTYDPEKMHISCGWTPFILSPRYLTFKKWYKTPHLEYSYLTDLLGAKFHVIANIHVVELDVPLALRISDRLLFELSKRRVYTLWLDTSIEAGATTAAIPGWGRKTIHFTSDTAGDLTVYLDAVGRNDWKEDVKAANTTDAILFTDHSGVRLRLGFSEAAKVTAHVVVEL